MNILVRPSIVLGVIAGAALGVVSVLGYIPFLSFLKCTMCLSFMFVGSGIVYYLKRNGFVGFLSLHDGAFVGAISGFIALIAASAVYVPITYMIGLFFSHTAKSGMGLVNSFMVTSYSFMIICMLVFFMALLSALFNAFSGLVVAYIYEKIENNPIQEESEFIIEQ